MAIAVQSVSSNTWASSNTCVITKPTGLAVGDLMIAIVQQKDVNTATCTLTGWTGIDTMDLNTTSGDYAWTLYKVADSGDVAASDFTFSLNNTAYVAGGILRIDGQASSSFINANDWAEQASNIINHSVACGITPSVAECLIIMGVFNSVNVTSSGYAVSTDNPASWSEAWDVGDGTAARSFACGYAIRTQTTSTGNAAFSTSGNSSSSATLIAVAPAVSASTSNFFQFF
jgi:hypothetical protein